MFIGKIRIAIFFAPKKKLNVEDIVFLKLKKGKNAIQYVINTKSQKLLILLNKYRIITNKLEVLVYLLIFYKILIFFYIFGWQLCLAV